MIIIYIKSRFNKEKKYFLLAVAAKRFKKYQRSLPLKGQLKREETSRAKLFLRKNVSQLK